jgi:hypothetical protein
LWIPSRGRGISVVANVAEVMRFGERVGRVLRDGSDGQGISRSVVAHAPHNTNFTRRGAARRWPPRAR